MNFSEIAKLNKHLTNTIFSIFSETKNHLSLKKTLLLLLFSTAILHSQDYVDLLEIGYGQTFNNDFEGSANSTQVKALEVDLTFPVILNEKHALVTGVLFSRNNLQIYPNDGTEIFHPGVDENKFASLYSTTLKLGLATTWNDTWSTTFVLLPKIASDYVNINGDDFYFGGVALLKQKKNENLTYKYGLYATSEAFGVFTTPIFGWYYLSPNGQFELNTSLPISANVNYTSGNFTYGFDYAGIGRSFRLHNEDIDGSLTYVDLSNLEFASYIQFNVLEKSVLLRANFGYATSNYEVYATDEKIDLGVSAFSFGDDRTQLNPDIGGGIFIKLEAVYRFNISDSTTPAELPTDDD